MKKETYEKAQRAITFIERMKMIRKAPNRFYLTLVDNSNGFDRLINTYYNLPERLKKKVEQWNIELKALIAEEIAALEKEFAELSDETMTETE